MIFNIFCLTIGAIWGWGFYQAVMHHSKFWVIAWAISFGLYEADRVYKSEIIKAFIKGLTQ